MRSVSASRLDDFTPFRAIDIRQMTLTPPSGSGSNGIGVDRRTDRAATPHLEVQVGRTRVAGVPHRAEHLPTHHRIADRQARSEVLQVVISVGVAIALQHPRVALVAGQDLLIDDDPVDMHATSGWPAWPSWRPMSMP